MKRTPIPFRPVPMAALVLALAGTAHAQSSGTTGTPGTTVTPGTDSTAPATSRSDYRTAPRSMASRDDGYSLIPYSSNGYIGFNLGKPSWDTPCGGGGFACDDSNASLNLYTGGMFNEHFGAEFGYVDFGRADRAGGRTRAHGLNLSLVGRWPIGQSLSVHARLGTIYGRTDTRADPASGLASGRETGWHPSYGVGIGFELSPRSAIVLDWNRYRLDFAGTGKRDITTTTLGYVHRF